MATELGMEKQAILSIMKAAQEIQTIHNELVGVAKKIIVQSEPYKDRQEGPAFLATLLAIKSAVKPLSDILEIHSAFARAIMSENMDEEDDFSDMDPISGSIN